MVFRAHRVHGSIATVVCPSGNYWRIEAIMGNGWYPGKPTPRNPAGSVCPVGPGGKPCCESIRVYTRLFSPAGEPLTVGTSVKAPPTPADLVYPAIRPGAKPGLGSVIAYTDSAEAIPSSAVMISFRGAVDCSGTVGTFYVAVEETFEDEVISIKETGKPKFYGTPAVRLINYLKELRTKSSSEEVDLKEVMDVVHGLGLCLDNGEVDFVLTNPGRRPGDAAGAGSA